MESTEVTYRVVFYGRLDEEKEKSIILSTLIRKVKMSERSARSLLNSNKAVVKKNLDKASAEKYQRSFEKLGVFLEVEEMRPAAVEPVVQSPVSTPVMPAHENPDVAQPKEPVETPPSAPEAPADTLPLEDGFEDEPEPSDAQESLSLVEQEKEPEDKAEADLTEAPEEGDIGDYVTETFEFDGNGFEYFKIWIVNILFTILTLGIYSAWAKVRNHQYFYGHTELVGARFQYLAKPLSILIGRLIVIPVLVVGSFLAEIFPVAALIYIILLLIAMPWIFYRSLRFNFRNTAYRNVRFDFKGDYLGSAAIIYGWPILGMITFGLLFPLSVKKSQTYIANNSCFGQTKFEADPPTKEYYVLAALFIATIAIGYGVGSGLAFLFGSQVFLMFGALGYIAAIFVWSAGITNLFFNHATLDVHGFSADYEAWGLFKLGILNTLGMLLTLGLFYPWAKVRVAKYKAEHTYLNVNGSLDEFINSEEVAKSSIGEELADALDVDAAAF